MKPSQYPAVGEKRGLFCPACGTEINTRMVAQSYPSAAGQYRMRVCRGCGAEVETAERVVGLAPDIVEISGLEAGQRRLVVQMIAQFRAQNAVVEIEHARLPGKRPLLESDQ